MTIATIDMPAPTIRHKERSITARYDTGNVRKRNDEDTEVRKILFAFEVHYNKAGINYFSGTMTTVDHYTVSVCNETITDNGIIGFTMGTGLGLWKIEQPSNRFSKKKMGQIFEEWQEKVEGWLSLDDNQLYLLDDIDQMLRAKIMPYWRGEKVGVI